MRNKTVLVIGHRLPGMSRADRLLVVDGGRLAETGTHAELLARDGLYARMWGTYHDAGNWTLRNVDGVSGTSSRRIILEGLKT